MKHILLCLFCLISFVLMAKSSIDIQALKQDARRGDVNAQVRLGALYYLGEGVAQSYPEAVKWYRIAAAQGNASAQLALGHCYSLGQGVAQNYPEAVKWFRKAAEQGNADAQFELGICYSFGDGVVQSYPEAVKWYRKAAEQGNADAQFELGICYGRGKGVTENAFETLKWWGKAAEQGHAEAKKLLVKFEEALSETLVDEARALYKKQIKALEQNDFYSYLYCSSSYGRKNNYDFIRKSFKEGVQGIKDGTQLSIRDVQFEKIENEMYYFQVTFRMTNRYLSSFNTEIKLRTAFIFEDDNFVIFMEQIL